MEIGFLLKKYAQLGFNQKRIRETVLSTLKDDFSIELLASEIEVKDSEVKIKISGVRKTQFVLMRSKIEEAIQKGLQKEGLFVSKIF